MEIITEAGAALVAVIGVVIWAIAANRTPPITLRGIAWICWAIAAIIWYVAGAATP